MERSGNTSTDDSELAERLADAIARVTWSDRAGGYQPPGLSLIAWATPPAVALRLIAAHPDPAARADGLAALDERARAGEGSAAAVRREVIAAIRAAAVTAICAVLSRAPLEDGRVQMAAVTALKKLKHAPPLVAAGRAILAHRLKELGDAEAAEHAQVAEALWEAHGRDPYGSFREEALAPYCLGMARWYLAAGDATKAGALLEQVMALGEYHPCVEPWREPLSDALAAAGRQDGARNERGVHALCAEARQQARSDPALAGELLARARTATSPELLQEQYEEGLITTAERDRVPQDLAWTAWRVGRREEALAELAAIDREIRADLRRVLPRASGELGEGTASNPFERARVPREELPALRASLDEELRRYKRKAVRVLLRLAAALARTSEAALGLELLDEVTAALRRRDPDGELNRLADRELVPALTAHGQLDLAMRVLERNGDMLWHASESAALVGALQAAGREEEARRVLRAAVEALDNRQGAMELVPAAGALLGAGAAERLGRAIEAADAQLEASALPGEGG